MPQAVKGKRPYNSRRRQEQAEATRRQILEAAQKLFERDGYAATTMAAIAEEAGVALKTVYLAFETKSGVLRGLWHLRLRGDVADVPVGERDWFRAVLEEPDPVRQLEMNARNSRTVKVRMGGLLAILRGAAPVDRDAADLYARMQSEYRENQRVVVESLRAKGALRDGLDVERATDILWTLNHPDVWHALTAERGWAPEEYEQWTAESARAQLLAER